MADIVRTAKKFDDPHRLLINLVMKLNAVRVNKIIEIFKRLCEACGTGVEAANDLENFSLAQVLIKTINKKFEEGSLLFRLHIVPDDRYKSESYIVWVNTTKFVKELSCCRSMNNEETLIFFHILDYMFNEPKVRGEIPTTVATGMGTDHNLMKPKDCDLFVRRLVADGVFTKNESRNSYSLHPRAVLELEVKLREEYNVPSCNICNKLATTGFTSTVCDTCENDFHNVCIVKLLGTNTQVKCPGKKDSSRCTKMFDHLIVDKFKFEKPIQSGGRTIKGVKVSSQRVDAVDDYEEEEEEVFENPKRRSYLGLNEDDIADDEEDDVREESIRLSRFYGSPIDARKRHSVKSSASSITIEEVNDLED